MSIPKKSFFDVEMRNQGNFNFEIGLPVYIFWFERISCSFFAKFQPNLCLDLVHIKVVEMGQREVGFAEVLEDDKELIFFNPYDVFG
jgi:hypothetical protein